MSIENDIFEHYQNEGRRILISNLEEREYE